MRLPNIVKNSALYSFTTLLQKGAAFFLLPLYTAFLTPEDYGIVNVVTSVSSFMAVLIMMALNGAATRFHYKNTDEGYRKILWGTVTTIVLISSIGWGAVFFTLHRFLVDPFIGEIDFYPYAVIGLANTVITPLYLLFQSYLQARQEAMHYSINTFSHFLVQVGLAIVFIAIYKMGAVGMLLSNVITSLIFFLYVLFVYIPRIRIGINKQVADESFKYSLPLLPHQISIWSAGTLDRLFLNNSKGAAITGVFSVGQQFGNVVGTVAYSVNQAFVPWFFQMIEKGKEGFRKIEQMGLFAVISYCLIAFVISLFSPEILRVMVSEGFRDAWKIIPFVSFAFVFHGVYFFFINILFIKDTGWVFVVTLSSMVIDIIFNILLIPLWGIWGCAIACFMTYVSRSIIALVLSLRKNKDIRYNYSMMFIAPLFLLSLSYVNIFLEGIPILWTLIMKLVLCTILGGIFYLKYKCSIKYLVSYLKTKK
jgi:O-antigen/teichoic acid export membrane protein